MFTVILLALITLFPSSLTADVFGVSCLPASDRHGQQAMLFVCLLGIKDEVIRILAAEWSHADYLLGFNDQVMTIYILKGQLHRDVIMFCKHPFSGQ